MKVRRLFQNGMRMAAIVLILPAAVQAAEAEVFVENIRAQAYTPMRYEVTGALVNPMPQAREVVLRAQISFYDRTSPAGDVPIFILRKDITEVIRPGEHREIVVPLINEGLPPAGAVRMEPMLRIRRQREWNYG